jgi:hypothetical protein
LDHFLILEEPFHEYDFKNYPFQIYKYLSEIFFHVVSSKENNGFLSLFTVREISRNIPLLLREHLYKDDKHI